MSKSPEQQEIGISPDSTSSVIKNLMSRSLELWRDNAEKRGDGDAEFYSGFIEENKTMRCLVKKQGPLRLVSAVEKRAVGKAIAEYLAQISDYECIGAISSKTRKVNDKLRPILTRLIQEGYLCQEHPLEQEQALRLGLIEFIPEDVLKSLSSPQDPNQWMSDNSIRARHFLRRKEVRP